MGELWRLLLEDRDTQLQCAYISGCAVALLAMFFRPSWRRRRAIPLEAPDVETPAIAQETALTTKSQSLNWHRWAEQPGPGALLHLLVFAGTALAALIGWRIPAEIERLYGDGAGFGLIFPNVTMPALGRFAQVLGAFTFAVVALRLLRFLIPTMALAVALCLAILAIQYIVGWQVGFGPLVR